MRRSAHCRTRPLSRSGAVQVFLFTRVNLLHDRWRPSRVNAERHLRTNDKASAVTPLSH